MKLEDLSAAVEHYTLPGGPGLYRNLYNLRDGDGPLKISSWEEWRALPFLTKEHLTHTPLAERTFVPIRDVGVFTASSGTSGKDVSFSYRSSLEAHVRYRFEYFARPTCHFVGLNPYVHRESNGYKALGFDTRIIACDSTNMRESIALAIAAGMDSASMHSFAVPEFCKALEQYPQAAARMRLVEVTGQVCPRSFTELLRENFPHAAIIHSYSITETGASPLGVSCRPYTKGDVYDMCHLCHHIHFDLIDTETDEPVEPVPGTEAEVLVTDALFPGLATPLIRYRVGDMVRTFETSCEHKRWTFAVAGRAELDFVKIPEGILHASEVARVLREYSLQVSDDFELRYYPSTSDTKRFRVELHVTALHGTSLSRLAEDIASRLRVSPTLTYAEGVVRGLYEPLRCVPLQNSAATGKRRRITKHVN